MGRIILNQLLPFANKDRAGAIAKQGFQAGTFIKPDKQFRPVVRSRADFLGNRWK